jgi:signal transduction histidine kinase
LIRPRWVLVFTLLSIVPLVILGDQARQRIGRTMEERAASDASSAAYSAELARAFIDARLQELFRASQQKLIYQHLLGEEDFRRGLRQLFLTDPLLELPEFFSEAALEQFALEPAQDPHESAHGLGGASGKAFKSALLKRLPVQLLAEAKVHLGYDEHTKMFKRSFADIDQSEAFPIDFEWIALRLRGPGGEICEQCVAWAKKIGYPVEGDRFDFFCVSFALPGGDETDTGIFGAIVPIGALIDGVLIPALSDWVVTGSRVMSGEHASMAASEFNARLRLRVRDLEGAIVFDAGSLDEWQKDAAGGNSEEAEGPSLLRVPLLGADSPWQLELRSASMMNLHELERGHQRWTLYFFAATAILILGALLLSRELLHQLEHSRLRNHLLSNISHELKTPLSLIRLYADTLEGGRVEGEEQRMRFLGIISRESKRLSHLIDNVLDIQRIEQDRKSYSFAQLRPDRIVEQTVEAYRFQLIEAGFDLRLDMDQELPLMMLDAGALAQALINLLDNAAKYSEAIKEIRIGCNRRDGEVRISVSDRGVGIAASEQKKVFESFYRVEKGLVHDVKGSGLGLAVVQHVAEAHGGRVELESTVGKGSRFTLCLPENFEPAVA